MSHDVVRSDNTASDVWVDTAHRSQSNERWLKAQGRVSRIHRRKPKGRLMSENVWRGNAAKSRIRAREGQKPRSRLVRADHNPPKS